MPRTNSTLVEGIIEGDSDISLDPFIEVANDLVTELCTSSDYSDAKLELIERWLSAHFYAVRESRVKTDQVRTLREEFQSRVDLGFDVTHYGQQAMRIDTAGNLAVLNNQVKKAGNPLPAEKKRTDIKWLGKNLRDYR